MFNFLTLKKGIPSIIHLSIGVQNVLLLFGPPHEHDKQIKRSEHQTIFEEINGTAYHHWLFYDSLITLLRSEDKRREIQFYYH